jgi:hypothetical protein
LWAPDPYVCSWAGTPGNYTTNFIPPGAHGRGSTRRALLFVNGTRTAMPGARGMHILSLANPTAPSFVAPRWPAGTGTPSQTDYILDCVPRSATGSRVLD